MGTFLQAIYMIRCTLLFIFFAIIILVLAERGIGERIEPSWVYDTNIIDGGSVHDVDFTADGSQLVAGTMGRSDYGKIILFNTTNSIPVWNSSGKNVIWEVAISNDGKYVVGGSTYGKNWIKLYNLEEQELQWTYNQWGYSVAFSDFAQYVVAGSRDTNIYYFSNSSASPIWKFKTGEEVKSVDISADGQTIVAGSNDNKLYLLNNSGGLLWDYDTVRDVTSVSISDDGQYIVAGTYGDDGTIYLFNREGEKLWNYSTEGWIFSIAISADGQYVVGGSYDDCVYYFNINSGNPLWSFCAGDDIRGVDLSYDGEYIAVASEDKNIYLLHQNSSIPLWSVMGKDIMYTVAISPDGKAVAGGGRGNRVYLIHDLDSDGILGGADKFPNDPSASNDSDGDGFPNYWNPGYNASTSTTNITHLDDFPDDPAASQDLDGDGYPEKWNQGQGPTTSTTQLWRDKFPNDPSASQDTDDDGFPDRWTQGLSSSDSTTGLYRLDDFPFDGKISLDTDGDGYADEWNPGFDPDEVVGKNWRAVRLDDFPYDRAASLDTDLDGRPDEWNQGKTQKDSTTGLTLDAYPDIPYRWHPATEDDESGGLLGTFTSKTGIRYFVVAITIVFPSILIIKIYLGSKGSRFKNG